MSESQVRRGAVWAAGFLSLVLAFSPAALADGTDQAAKAEQLKSATHSLRTQTPLAPGIEHLHWHIVPGPRQPGPWNINVLLVDLAQPGVELKVVEAQAGLETTRSIARRVGAVAAVNGGYFSKDGPLGLVVVEGEIRSSTVPSKPPRAAFGLWDNRAWIDIVDQKGKRLIPLRPVEPFDWAKVKYALGAGPRILAGAKVNINAASEGFDDKSGVDLRGNSPRTAVGIRRNKVFLMTVDGRQPELSIGFSLEQAAGFLFSRCGATRAMALDGGGSTTMVIRDQVVNFPSDRDAEGHRWVERPVANALCVFSREAHP